MNTEQKTQTEDPFATRIDTPILVYVLFLSALFLGVTLFIGGAWAFFEKNSAPVWLKTHYEFLFATFWKTLIFLFLGLMTLTIYIGPLIWALMIIWYVARTAKGLQLVTQRRPIEDPKTWLF